MKIALGWKGRRWFHKLSGIYRKSFRFLKRWMLCGNRENKTWQRRQTEHIRSSDQNVGEVEHGVSWTPPPSFLRLIYNSPVWQLLTITGLNFAVLSTFYLNSTYASILKDEALLWCLQSLRASLLPHSCCLSLFENKAHETVT